MVEILPENENFGKNKKGKEEDENDWKSRSTSRGVTRCLTGR